MMRNHRGAVLVLIVIIGLSMSGIAQILPAHAQDVPIQSVEEAEGPDELVVEGLRYLKDRNVVVNVQPLQEATDENGNVVYRKPGGSDPLGAVYLLSPETEGEATRYLPEFVGDPAATCPAETVGGGTLEGNGATYIPAGPETDMTADQLTTIGSTGEGFNIYAYSSEPPFDEILVAQSQGQGNVPLTRYVVIDANGIPGPLAEQLVFAGQQFAPAPGAVASLEGLTRAGCAGLFPVYAAETGGPFPTVVLDVGGQAVSFEALEAEAPEAPVDDPGTPVDQTPIVAPTVEVQPTEEPTLPPTEAPTQVPPTEEPTVAPTEVPTEEPTVPPTKVPTVAPTETPIPTEIPTEVPTEVPTVPPTEAPTVPPTEAPTAAATEAPTDAGPTAAPTAAATQAPPDVAAGDEPRALPTEVPPTPAPGTPAPTLPPSRPTPTPRPLQPQAVVPTLPADIASPPASRATTGVCGGNAGEIDANGVPERLPRNIQYGGSSYRYSGTVGTADVGAIEDAGCVGAFTISIPTEDTDDQSLYLRLAAAPDSLYRFEMTTSFTVRSEVDDAPRSLETAATEDQPAVQYQAADPLVRSVYSSVSLIVYVANAEEPAPDRLLGYAVATDVLGEYVPEGQGEQASQEVLDRAETLGVHAEMNLNGQRYVLISLWTPYGTTTNGWVTLYGPEGENAPAQLVGIDPRRLDLLVFDRAD